jgi:uncharacterized membrane protein YeaQ/YmgE (transglycosylase-associated protein family)
MWQLLLFLLIGGVAGWVAGQITKGKGFGLPGNLLIGILGAFLGGLLFRVLGLYPTSLLGALVTAVVGSTLLLVLLRRMKHRF